GPDHKDVAVREVDEAQDPVDHRVTQRNQRVDGAQRKAVDELLEEFRHRMTVSPLPPAPGRFPERGIYSASRSDGPIAPNPIHSLFPFRDAKRTEVRAPSRLPIRRARWLQALPNEGIAGKGTGCALSRLNIL